MLTQIRLDQTFFGSSLNWVYTVKELSKTMQQTAKTDDVCLIGASRVKAPFCEICCYFQFCVVMIIFSTLSFLASSDFRRLLITLQTIWTRIRTDKMLVLISIQTN